MKFRPFDLGAYLKSVIALVPFIGVQGLIHVGLWRQVGSRPGGGGGALTQDLSLGTNCETTAPFFDKGQPLVLPSPNLHGYPRTAP